VLDLQSGRQQLRAAPARRRIRRLPARLGAADARDADNTLEDYIDRYMPEACDTVLDCSSRGGVNLARMLFDGVLCKLSAVPRCPGALTDDDRDAVDFSNAPMFSEMLREGRSQAAQRRSNPFRPFSTSCTVAAHP
jgi:hypothetical protein